MKTELLIMLLCGGALVFSQENEVEEKNPAEEKPEDKKDNKEKEITKEQKR